MLTILDERYVEILEILDKHCNLSEFLSPDNFYEYITEPLKNSSLVNWTYDNGSTKLVLILKGMKSVIKIPFDGCERYYCDGDWGATCQKDKSLPKNDYFSQCCECSRDCPRRGSDSPMEFCGSIGESAWDYCEAETIYYNMACQTGIETFFAKTWKIGEVQGRPIYAQVRAEMFEGVSSSKQYAKNKTQPIEDFCNENNFYCFNEYWLVDFADYFGKDSLEKLLLFIEEEGIRDLHDGNIGYVDGVPVLVDYSGFSH